MKIPFTYESVEGELEGPLVISRNKMGSNVFSPVAKVEFLPCGEAEGAEGWSVEDGVLTIDMGPQTGLFEFNGVESRNGRVYAVGLHNADRAEGYRATLHVASAIGDRFGVCISSNKKYESETIPVIAKCLRKAGIDKENVMVVIGECKNADGEPYESEGLMTVKTASRGRGFTALQEAAGRPDMDYWVLLHDTCTVSSDFKEKIAAIDVGLNADVTLFSCLEDGSEIGVYSSKYLSNGVVDLGRRPSDILGDLVGEAKVVVESVALPTKGGERDVYGGGVMRKAMEMKGAGVVKNVRRKGRKNRP